MFAVPIAPIRTWLAIWAVAAAGLVAGCASGPPLRPNATALAAGLFGVYDNSAQWAQMAESFRATSGVSAVDVRFVRLGASALGDVLLYEEWRAPDAAKTGLRQRIWSVREYGDGLRIDRFDLANPQRFLGAGADAFLSLSPDDVRSMGFGCALTVVFVDAANWSAQTSPSCRAASTGGSEERLNTRITRMPTGVLYAETRGQTDPGDVATPFDLHKR